MKSKNMPTHPATHIGTNIASLLESHWPAIQETCNEAGDAKTAVGITLTFEPSGVVLFGIRISYSKREKAEVEGTYDPNQPDLPLS